MKLKPLLSTLVIAIALTVTVGLVQQRQIFQKKAAPASTTLTFIHQDHLGSISMVTDAAGHVVSRKTYNPYGSIKSSEGEFPTERGYTGQVSDSRETGLLYYNARYYDPVIAKFTQADKAADTLNKYAYVGNNPINRTDPSGNQYQVPDPQDLNEDNSSGYDYLVFQQNVGICHNRKSWLGKFIWYW